LFAALFNWHRSHLAHREWDRLHARRPIPLAAASVWGGLTAYVVAMSFPWGLTPLEIPVPGSPGWQSTLLTTEATVARWVHAAVFWALPWVLFEWRLGVGRRPWEELEGRTTALIRLFGYALLFYPLIRLALFGVSRLAYRGLPAPTIIDAILLDAERPIVERYLWSLAVEGHFALITLILVTCRLRVAQWASVIVIRPPARLMLYALPTLGMTVLLILLKGTLYDPLAQSEFWRQGDVIVHFVRVVCPWSLVIASLALLVGGWARLEARRRVAGDPLALRT
jgi:hypothetical protein